MKAAQIKVGGTYHARVSGNYVTVRVDAIRERFDHKDRSRTVYDVTNLNTGRKLVFQSAMKFRSAVAVSKLDEVVRPEATADRLLQEERAAVIEEMPDGGKVEGGQCSDPTTVGTSAKIATEPEMTQTAAGAEPVATTDGSKCNGLASKIAQHVSTARQLTDEQQAIIAAAPTTQVLVIEAGAGCGKTSTLVELAKSTPGIGQYTAFNASLVAESKTKFPRNVQCNTIHSLAFRSEGVKHQHRLGGRRTTGSEVAAMLGLRDMTIEGADGKPKVLNAGLLASQVTRAIRNFCQSADRDTVGIHRIPRLVGIDAEHSTANSDMVKEHLLPFAQKMWADKCNPAGTMPFTHDDYVKMWELNDPTIGADYVLLDEAQDTSPVMLSIMEQQVRKGARVILVGDSAQQIYCQPEGTMVRVPIVDTSKPCGRGLGGPTWTWGDVPIEKLCVGDRVVSYSPHWRLGLIRQKGCCISEITEKAYSGTMITVSVDGAQTKYTPDHHCVVMLGKPASGKWAVYIQRRGNCYRAGACSGNYDSQGGTFGPYQRARQEKADAIWIVDVFDNKNDALALEKVLHESVPSRCFASSGGGEWWKDQESNEEDTAWLLSQLGLDISEPLTTVGEQLDHSRTTFVTAARNLMDGMMMLPVKNVTTNKRAMPVKKYHWRTIKVSKGYANCRVFSISVDDDHTYVADGVVTHNSWRGAVNALAAFPDAPRLMLSQSFRFGQVVAEVANATLSHLTKPTPLVMRGFDIQSRLDSVANPTAILCRTNAGAVSHLIDGIARGKHPFLIGGGDDVAAFVRAAGDLQRSKSTNHPELCCFSNWREVQAYAKTEDGEDLRLIVKLIDQFTVNRLLAAIGGMPDEKDADLVISTAHKSKGREWSAVKLASDFKPLDKMGDEEVRLLYVAATRAQHVLDVETCPPFCGGQKRADEGWNGEGGELRTVDISEARRLSNRVPKPQAPQPTEQPKPTEDKRTNGGNTWAKGRSGDWLVRGKVGQTGEVEVVSRKGEAKKVTIKRVVWKNEEVALYEVA